MAQLQSQDQRRDRSKAACSASCPGVPEPSPRTLQEEPLGLCWVPLLLVALRPCFLAQATWTLSVLAAAPAGR